MTASWSFGIIAGRLLRASHPFESWVLEGFVSLDDDDRPLILVRLCLSFLGLCVMPLIANGMDLPVFILLFTCLVAIILLRVLRVLAIPSIVFVFGSSFGFFLRACYMGVNSYVLPMFVCPLMIAWYLGGSKGGSYAFVLQLTQLLLLHVVGHFNSFSQPSVLNPEWNSMLYTYCVLLSIIAVHVFCYFSITRLTHSISVKSELMRKMQVTSAELDRSFKEIERAHRAKSELISFVSHEIRNPLHAIIALTDFMLDEAMDATVQSLREDARSIRASTELIMCIVNDVLDMSKIESGKIQLENVPFNVQLLLQAQFHMFQARAREKGLKLCVELGNNVPPFVVGDPTRLNQVMSNLLSNAIKFTSTGSVLLQLVRYEPSMDLEQDVVFQNDTTKDIADKMKEKEQDEATENVQTDQTAKDNTKSKGKNKNKNKDKNKQDQNRGQEDDKSAPSQDFDGPDTTRDEDINEKKAEKVSEEDNGSSSQCMGCETKEQPRPHVDLCLRVVDTGAGMSMEEMSKLFQPYSQTKLSTTRTHGGSGLGLSICHQIARLMGGRLACKSRVDEGSTFSFFFSLDQAMGDDLQSIVALPVASQLQRISTFSFSPDVANPLLPTASTPVSSDVFPNLSNHLPSPMHSGSLTRRHLTTSRVGTPDSPITSSAAPSPSHSQSPYSVSPPITPSSQAHPFAYSRPSPRSPTHKLAATSSTESESDNDERSLSRLPTSSSTSPISSSSIASSMSSPFSTSPAGLPPRHSAVISDDPDKPSPFVPQRRISPPRTQSSLSTATIQLASTHPTTPSPNSSPQQNKRSFAVLPSPLSFVRNTSAKPSRSHAPSSPSGSVSSLSPPIVELDSVDGDGGDDPHVPASSMRQRILQQRTSSIDTLMRQDGFSPSASRRLRELDGSEDGTSNLDRDRWPDVDDGQRGASRTTSSSSIGTPTRRRQSIPGEAPFSPSPLDPSRVLNSYSEAIGGMYRNQTPMSQSPVVPALSLASSPAVRRIAELDAGEQKIQPKPAAAMTTPSLDIDLANNTTEKPDRISCMPKPRVLLCEDSSINQKLFLRMMCGDRAKPSAIRTKALHGPVPVPAVAAIKSHSNPNTPTSANAYPNHQIASAPTSLRSVKDVLMDLRSPSSASSFSPLPSPVSYSSHAAQNESQGQSTTLSPVPSSGFFSPKLGEPGFEFEIDVASNGVECVDMVMARQMFLMQCQQQCIANDHNNASHCHGHNQSYNQNYTQNRKPVSDQSPDQPGQGEEATDADVTTSKSNPPEFPNPYLMIFMDLYMPERDGYEATRMLRSMGYTMPIIALTANVLNHEEQRCEVAGMQGFITKPYRRAQILEQLRCHVFESESTTGSQSSSSISSASSASSSLLQ